MNTGVGRPGQCGLKVLLITAVHGEAVNWNIQVT